MLWGKKKAALEDVFPLVAQNFYRFHNPRFAAAVKAIHPAQGEQHSQRVMVSMRALQVISCLYSALCIMECAEVGLRTVEGDGKIEGLVKAGLKDFMKEAPDVYAEIEKSLFSSRIGEINAFLQISGGKQRDEGNSLMVMFALDRILGDGKFASNPDALIQEAQVFSKAIFDVRVAFKNGLKR